MFVNRTFVLFCVQNSFCFKAIKGLVLHFFTLIKCPVYALQIKNITFFNEQLHKCENKK